MKLVIRVARSSKIVAIEALRARANCSSRLTSHRHTDRWRNNVVPPRGGLLLLRYKRCRSSSAINSDSLWLHQRSRFLFWGRNEKPFPLSVVGALEAYDCYEAGVASIAGFTGSVV